MNKQDKWDKINKFFEKQKLPKLHQEEIDNLICLTSIEEDKIIVENFPTKKTSAPDSYADEFYQT